jgi:hypothetical protein
LKSPVGSEHFSVSAPGLPNLPSIVDSRHALRPKFIVFPGGKGTRSLNVVMVVPRFDGSLNGTAATLPQPLRANKATSRNVCIRRRHQTNFGHARAVGEDAMSGSVLGETARETAQDFGRHGAAELRFSRRLLLPFVGAMFDA